MTLQEAKEEIAKTRFKSTWAEIKYRHSRDGMETTMGEVAELYARSKWEECCKTYEDGFTIPRKRPIFKP